VTAPEITAVSYPNNRPPRVATNVSPITSDVLTPAPVSLFPTFIRPLELHRRFAASLSFRDWPAWQDCARARPVHGVPSGAVALLVALPYWSGDYRPVKWRLRTPAPYMIRPFDLRGSDFMSESQGSRGVSRRAVLKARASVPARPRCRARDGPARDGPAFRR